MICTVKRRQRRDEKKEVVGVGLRDKDGNIFLVRTRKLSDWWQPIAGEVSSGEVSLVEAAKQHVKQQLGILLDNDELQLRFTITYDFCEGTVYAYEAVIDRSSLQLKVNGRAIAEHGWFSLQESLELQMFPSTATFLQKLSSDVA
jgi:8-oxo-dGTP pyrophosphatase MutT (NUDIX family)